MNERGIDAKIVRCLLVCLVEVFLVSVLDSFDIYGNNREIIVLFLSAKYMTFRLRLLCVLLIENRDKMKTKVYKYEIEDIATRVEQLTSKIGQMRTDSDKKMTLYERMSMTEGERFLFDEFLRDGVDEVYSYLQAFGSVVDMACVINDSEPIEVKENDGVVIGVDGVRSDTRLKLDVSSFSTDGVDRLLINISPIHITNPKKDKITIVFTCSYTASVNGSPLVYGKLSTEQSYVAEDFYITSLVFDGLALQSAMGQIEVEDVNGLSGDVHVVWSDSTAIGFGSLVRYTDCLGSDNYYYALEDCASDTFEASKRMLADGDESGCVVYRLEQKEWQDEQMLNRVYRYIKEALINYIIWRWFEMVNTDESEVYALRWQKYCEDAQAGLNSERVTLRRRYNMF